jgi:hypothetical protein
MSSAATAPEPTSIDLDGFKAAVRAMNGETVTLISRWGHDDPTPTRERGHLHFGLDICFKHDEGTMFLAFPWARAAYRVGPDRAVIVTEDVTWEIVREPDGASA